MIESKSARGQVEFFIVREDYGISLHLTFGRTLDNGTLRLEWARMPFKKDVLRLLRSDSLGTLPSTSMTQKFYNLTQLRDLRWLA